MRKNLLFAGIFVLSSILLVAVLAGTDTNQYEEDFTSKLYCDTPNTTAWWDTINGELKLPPFELTLAGSYDTPGYASGVTIAGDYAYVADQSSGLLVIDISDPTNPSLAGSYNTSGSAMGVDITGDYAYVADWTAGLRVIDISDPTSPSLAGSYDSPYNIQAVTVDGDYAYAADYDYGLQVIDISDPTNPSLAGSYYTPGTAQFVSVSGDYAYVADHDYGLQVIDISDPTSPSLAGSYNTSGNAMGVTISGDYAYVADLYPGLQVIDISDPTNPSLAGSINTPGAAYLVAISGDYAYVADYDNGLQVIDISDPTSPALRGSYDTPGNALGVAFSGDYAYVTDGTSGLQVIDISDPVSPEQCGSYDASEAWNVAVAGDYAYLAIGFSGFLVIDISDPTNPSLSGSYDTPGRVYCIAISGDYAYVADQTSGLQVIDISDPTSPSLAGSYDTPDYAIWVTISGNYAYVADLGSGLQVIDISDPTSPVLAGSYDTPGRARGVDISGDYAYVADDTDGGLQVIDISDPTSPSLAGSYDTPGIAYRVDISGDYAYVADYTYGLQVIDISDPTTPSLAGSYDTPGVAEGVTIAGDYAYVADLGSGLQVVDISDPTSPSLAGSIDTPGDAYYVAVSGDYAFVADYYTLEVIWIFQRYVKTADNKGQSVQINTSSDDILAVKLSSTQTDTVQWELSANGGTDWQEVLPGTSWNTILAPGNDFRWRSTHIYTQPFVNPSCSNLVIDWLYPYSLIYTITDIPNDQGKQVRVTWLRSGYDYVGSPTPITEYAIYRKIDYDLTSLPVTISRRPEVPAGAPLLTGMEGEGMPSTSGPVRTLAYPPGNWDFIETVPARVEDSYSVVVPTLADSTITEGMYHTTFFISALTDTMGIYFDSPPDSGYSVDNLAPHVPTGFAIAYNTGSGTELIWEECLDDDFQYFCIYRSESEDFEPDPGTLVHLTIDTNWLDTVAEGWRYHYKITAVDFSGNESDAASAGMVTGDDTPTVPKKFALYQNVPNPFNPTTVILFDLPVRSHVKLAVYNVKGQLVCVLLDGDIDAGRREVKWDGRDSMGRVVASGIYFYRLDTPAFSESRKMILLR